MNNYNEKRKRIYGPILCPGEYYIELEDNGLTCNKNYCWVCDNILCRLL